MAVAEHRKLFPVLQINQTVGCSDGNCDPICQNGCYPYSYSEQFPPPKFPPPPPQLPLPSSSSSKHVLSISPYIIIAGALLASFLLLLGYYLIIVRNCSGWRGRRRRPDDEGGDFLDENRFPAATDHPVWYIRTVGLPPSVIGGIAVFEYKKGEKLIGETECSVCLNEFRDDEKIRRLPKCNHGFHLTCIDTWLSSHTNCPLCRAAIVSDNSSAGAAAPAPHISTANEAVAAESSSDEAENHEIEVRIQEYEQIRRGIRRSFSIDSSIAANIQKTVTGDSSVEESFCKSQILMTRSFSYGGRSFFSGPNPTPNSILPL